MEERRDRREEGENKGERRDKEPVVTMDEATPANDNTGSASTAAAAADDDESEVGALGSTPFDSAATKKRLEAKRSADNEARLKAAKNKKAKQLGAHAYVREYEKYFQTYVQTQLHCYAICNLRSTLLASLGQ